MPTALSILTNLDLERNQLLRAAVELVATPDATPVSGQIAFTDGTVTAYPKWSVLIRDGETPTPGWRVLGAINKAHTVTGLWTFKPDFKADGSPAVSGDPPFAVDLGRGGRVVNLNADLLDGWHAISPVPDGVTAPSGSQIPVYDASGRMAVADPSTEYQVVNLRTLQAASQGISPRDPCQYASAANLNGTRSGNVLTGAINGVLVVDGLNPIVAERVLVKNQTTTADNGIYTVTNAGAAGAPWVLTRASDADTTAEIRVGTTTYIEKGTINIASQWQCSTAGTLNTDPNLWVKSFQQSSYLAGKGLVLSGLTFHFGTASNYTLGSLWYSNTTSTVVQLAPPGSEKFLYHPGGGVAPSWADVDWSKVTNKPGLVYPPGAGGTLGRYARWDVGNTLQDAQLLESANSVVGFGNSLVAATVSLGNDAAPYAGVWTNVLRLKTTAGATGQLDFLLGPAKAAGDPNANHKQAFAWAASEVKTWLAFATSDIGAVPTSRSLSIFGAAGQITVAPQNTWDLSADRTWNLALDLATLDGHWMTLHTAQTVDGAKTWESSTSSASETLIAVRTGPASANPTWLVKAGGAVFWGDGVAAPTASIDFANNRLRFDGKPVEFAATAVIRATSALSGQGTPTTLLGLTATDDVQRVTAANLSAFLGSPTLAAGAVGYGGSDGRLTGNASVFAWDAVNTRLGLGLASPAATLDIVGSLKLVNSVTSGTYPGLNLSVTDTSAASADWTSRTLIGQSLAVTKSGEATHVTSGVLEGQRTTVNVSNGTLSALFGHKLLIVVGRSVSGVAVTAVYGYYSQPSGAAGSVGTVQSLYQFAAADRVAPWPQPVVHYAFHSPNLTSATGATRTAGLALELSSTGSGERFNIYAPGSAANYLAGNLGLGVTAPAARLEFAVGTTTLAPVRFAAASAATSLLNTPLAGMLESRGDRLTFTDATPSRHLLAYLDDGGFTNDPSAAPGGAVVFGVGDYIEAPLTAAGYTEAIGTDPYTLWARFLVPITYRGPSQDFIVAVQSSSRGSQFPVGLVMTVGSAGQLYFYLASSGTNFSRFQRLGLCADLGGRVVDVVVVRSAGNTKPLLYINGAPQTTSDAPGGTPPGWNSAVVSNFLQLGTISSSQGSIGRVHRAALFNYAMPANEVLALSQSGLDSQDQWGSYNPVISDSFAAGLGSWNGTDLTNQTVAAAQTVNGTPNWASITRTNTTGPIEFTRTMSGQPIAKKYVLKATFFAPMSSPGFFGVSTGVTASNIYSKQPVTAAVDAPLYLLLSSNQSNTFTAVRTEPGTSATPAGAVSFAVGTTYSFKDPKILRAGALLDLDLGVGCGSAFPDRSGRYHGAAAGTGWTHYIATCPTEIPSGSGTLSRGLRRYTQSIAAKDNDLVTVTHGLSTANLTVTVWDAAGEMVHAPARRKTGSETTAVEIGFGLVGSPSTPVAFLVVIVG